MSPPTPSPASLGSVAPCFIVSDVSRAIAFYEGLGFEVRARAPAADPFFAIVGRDAVQIHLKNPSDDEVRVAPQPNHTRHAWMPWDAFVHTEDPDGLAAELESRGVGLYEALGDRDDGLRGFAVRDADGYALFFGRPL